MDTINRTSATALQQFSGYFADVFRDNVGTARVDGQNIVTCMKALALYTGELVSAATSENRRRAHAREWIRQQKAASMGLGGDAPGALSRGPLPYDIDEKGPSHAVGEVALRPRVQPGRGTGGGTSSACPEKLRTFSTGSSGGGSGSILSGGTSGATLQAAWDRFIAGCQWGSLTEGGVISAVTRWQKANADDMVWIATVAAAFEAAGGNSAVSRVSDRSLEAALTAAGVSVVRSGIDVSAPTLQGVLPTTGYINDPVNTATGNFIEPETDLAFGGAASSLALTRMYNSMNEGMGAFGHGWSSVLDVRLELSDEGAAFVMADGRHILFGRHGDGWSRADHSSFWLAEEPSASGDPHALELVVRDNAGSWWAFSRAGTWRGQGNGPGSSVRVLRDHSGRVTGLVHERGREIRVEYEGPRVTGVVGSDGRRMEYSYDEDGRLIAATGESGQRSYRWNDAGLIDRVTSAAGVVECENVYDDKRRVIQQVTEFGRVVRFAYLPGRVTEVSDADGGNANTWIADRHGRLVGVVDTDDRRQSMAYDAHGNLVSVTERDGQTTVYAFDSRGRRVRTVTPEGADTEYSYDEHDRVVAIQSGPESVTRFEYASVDDRLPRRVIDALGGVTVYEWDQGLLIRTVDPTGVQVTFGYDALGELTSATDAAGNTTRFERDSTGQLAAIVSPAGHRTQFAFDAGVMVRRADPDGATWNFEYTTGRRLAAVVDPVGARTSFEYGPHGRVTHVTDALGRTTAQAFDEMGNLAGLTLADGAQWSFVHDGLARLREVVDPSGGSWKREYDAIGHLSATMDPTGVRQEMTLRRRERREDARTAFGESSVRFDETGRVVERTAEDGARTAISYDLCGREIELVDAEGGVTRIVRDAAGRPREVQSPAGRSIHFTYDECGRPSAMQDGAGGRTVLHYDADSRVVRRVLPTGEAETVDYDPLGRVTRITTPGRGTSRYRYDLLGRVVWTQDPRDGTRSFRYDAAGQLIAATNGIGGETTYERDRLGRVTRIVDPLGGVTERSYTVLNRVAAVSDPLGRTTTARYDAAGRPVSQTDAEGRTFSLAYDEGGRVSGMGGDGERFTEIERPRGSRAEIVSDFTHPRRDVVVHQVTRDRLNRLTGRSRDEAVTSWGYDPDGLRTSVVTAGGDRVEYVHDAAGRLTSVDHSAFGSVTYQYDAAGNLLAARAGDLLQTWTYRDGCVVEHTRIDDGGAEVTRISRDPDGRVIGLSGPDGDTGYHYDGAGQLVRAVSTQHGTREWTYDVAGRLIGESGPDGTVEFVYDAAGQLLSRSDSVAGSSTRFEYDKLGRRVAEAAGDRSTRYTWDDRGWLSGVSASSEGAVSEQSLWVDALGELAEVDGRAVEWDTARQFPALLSFGGASFLSSPGGLTGSRSGWADAGWRMVRSASQRDPWSVAPALPGGVFGAESISTVVGVDGSLRLSGLEWMGARAYDPATRGFLSVDPLQPPAGVAWAGNPYSFAGNDPLNRLDPLGQRPVTDADLVRQYAKDVGSLDRELLDQITRLYDYNELTWSTIAALFKGGVEGYEKWRATWPGWIKGLAKVGKLIPIAGSVVSGADFAAAIHDGDPVGIVRHGGSLLIDGITAALAPTGIGGVVGSGVGLVWDLGWDASDAIGDVATHQKQFVKYYEDHPGDRWLLFVAPLEAMRIWRN